MLRRVLILDLNYQLNRAARTPGLAALHDSQGRKTGGVFGLLNTVQLCLTRCQGADKVIGVWDGGYSSRRLALYPPQPDAVPPIGYKVKRGILPGMKPEEKAEKEEMFATLAHCRAVANPLLLASAIHVVQWPGREADDVIAALARAMAGRYAEQVIVASDDWDYAQMVSETICVHRPAADEWLSLHNFVQQLKVPIDWAVVKKALEGDDSDCIPGVKGVGEVTVAKAVKEYVAATLPGYQESWYDAHQYRNTCPADITPFFDFCAKHKAAKIKKIAEGRDVALRNMELVDLSREVFPPEHVEMLVGGVMQPREFQDMEVGRLFAELDFNKLLENFAYWSDPFRRIS